VGGENNDPTCGFTAPNNGDAFVVGESVIFSGTAMDEDISNSDLTVEISSNLDGVFQNLIPNSDGTFSFATNTLSNGTHTVTLLATDEVGAECRTSILVSIGNAPLASIDEPLDGSVFSVGETVTFRGTVSDSEDQANQIAVVWNSDIEGELQSGNANSQGVSQFTRSDLSAGVHSVSFSATDTSGLISDDLISFRVNTLPTVDSITLSPDPVYTDDNLVVTANGSDLDGQNVTMTYAWYENGTATSFTGTSINASELQVGETWTVRVTPNDGFQDGTYLEEMITISNTDPTVTIPTISPSSNINANSQLTCAATGSDLDDGTLTPTYTWTSSGGATNTGATWQLSPSMISGSETITCTASVTDANGATASSTSASVTVDNTPPTSTGIAISPSTGVVTGSALTCSAGFNDLEDGALTPTYAWTVNGTNVSNTATYTVSVNDTNVGDSIVCTASVTDSDSNTVTDSASVTVDNTNPTIGNVAISPSSLVVNDSTLTCSATASDIDETVSPTFAWNQNGTQFATGATVDLSQYSINPSDSIECVASVADSNGGTASGTDSVGIGNRAPIVDSISISNTSPEANETITCTATASDADGTTPTLTYIWMNGTTQIGTGSSVTLTPNTAGVGDPILCMATATDAGGMIGGLSDLATVINTVPTITAANIAPTSANANDLLTCTATGNDLNDGSLTPSFAWTASGGATHSGVTWSLSSANVSGGETITCTATVTDNDQATVTSSASITLDNSVPTVDSISISPNTGVVTNTALTCAATISDTEDGSLTPTYEWTVNGATVSSTATYTVSGYQTNVGDSIVCTASATDSDGNPVSNTASVTVDNTTPTVNNVAIATSDSGNYNTSTYTCTAATNDPDMNSSTTFTYSVGGTEIGNGTSSNLDAATEALLPGDVVVCTVEIVDGDTGTSTSQSASVTLANRAPTTPTATITWSGSGNTPAAGDSLTCTGSGSSDPDGQSVSYTYTWLTSASSGPSTGATVGASFTSGGDTWTCSAVATDGTATSSAGTDSVTIASSCGLTNCDTNLDLGGGQSMDLVLIPSGSDPQGRYTITSDFYLMTTEVTQGMFTALMSYDPTTYSTTYGVGNDYPAYYVSWHMAADFANKVTQRHNSVNGTSLQECYSCSSSGSTSVSCTEAVNPYQCSGYVLPTEAEWEYAARSGTQYDFWTPDGGGNYSANTTTGNETIVDGVSNPLLRDYAWYGGNNYNQYGVYGSKEVGQKLPNGFGLYDMHGNLWEWTADWWSCSFPQTSTDPYCGSAGSYRVERGGGWSGSPSGLRASYRYNNYPTGRYYYIGFRLGLHP
jgi:formylglycine-generating enzyme required for sulfatase activity